MSSGEQMLKASMQAGGLGGEGVSGSKLETQALDLGMAWGLGRGT